MCYAKFARSFVYLYKFTAFKLTLYCFSYSDNAGKQHDRQTDRQNAALPYAFGCHLGIITQKPLEKLKFPCLTFDSLI